MPDNADRLLELARKEFLYLTEAELEVIRCAPTDKVVDLAKWDPFTPVTNEPPLAKYLRSATRQEILQFCAPMRARFIEWLCTCPEAKHFVHRTGIAIVNADFDMTINLDNTELPFSIAFITCNLKGISAQGTIIHGNLVLKICSINGSVNISGIVLHGQLQLEATNINNKNGVALIAENALINADVFLNNKFSAQGAVKLQGATIKGNFECSAGMFRNSRSTALTLDSATIIGDVLLDDGILVRGEVSLAGAKLCSDLVCRNGKFVNRLSRFHKESIPYGINTIYASCANIAGRVFLDGNFKSHGRVYLRSAEIHRHVDCTDGVFINANGEAFNAFCCTFDDSLTLRPEKIAGKVDLCRANIANDLTTTGATALRDCELDLSGARIGRLCDSRDSWPRPGKLHIDGLTYESIICDAPTRAKDRLEWLSLMPGKHFMPQPFEQLAAWYHRAGHDSFARDIRIAKERARLKQWLSLFSKGYRRELWAKLRDTKQNSSATCQMESPHKPWKLFLKEPLKRLWWWTKDITVGYGYKPHFALLWLCVIWLGGAIVFARSFPEGVTQSVSYKYSTRDQNLKDLTNSKEPLGLVLSTNYPAFNPYIYSLDVALPIVDLQQERYWMPNSETEEGRKLWWFNWFEVLMGWFLASMGIAGATGIIRKD